MFKQDELKYGFDELEPYIDAQTMEVHYTKHHAGYTAKFNASIEGVVEVEGKTAAEILKMALQLPADRQQDIINNGGGYFNHNLYWKNMTPNGNELVDEKLTEAINQQYGSLEAFKEKFTEQGMSVFGSGWVFLTKDNQTGKLEIYRNSFQNNPITKYDVTPILALDVWEHAYYLKHQNKRDMYIADWWNVVDWVEVASLFHS